MPTYLYTSLIVFLFTFNLSGQKALIEIQELLTESFSNQVSNTKPYDLTNQHISFGQEDPCSVTIVIHEQNIVSKDQRVIHYMFNARDIDLTAKWELKDGIFSIPVTYQEQLKVLIYQEENLVKETNSDRVELAAKKDNFTLVDQVEALADYCLNK